MSITLVWFARFFCFFTGGLRFRFEILQNSLVVSGFFSILPDFLAFFRNCSFMRDPIILILELVFMRFFRFFSRFKFFLRNSLVFVVKFLLLFYRIPWCFFKILLILHILLAVFRFIGILPDSSIFFLLYSRVFSGLFFEFF